MSDLKVIKVFRLPNRNPESLVKMLGMEMKEFRVIREPKGSPDFLVFQELRVRKESKESRLKDKEVIPDIRVLLVFRVAMDLRAGQEIGDHLGLPVLRVKRVTRVNRDTGKNNY